MKNILQILNTDISSLGSKKKTETDSTSQLSSTPSSSKKARRGLAIYFGLGKEKEYLLDNLSFLISSGMPVAEALHSVEGELKTNLMREVISEARINVENGMSLSQALLQTELFGHHTISLIKSGEESGNLSANLRLIAEQEEKNRIFKAKLRSALMYPVLVFSVTIIVGVGVAWFILPKLANVFYQLHVPLPTLTKIFIDIGKFLGAYGVYVVPSFFVFFIALFYFLFFYPKTRFLGQYILFSFPGIRRLLQEIEIARLGYLLGTLFQSGLPVMQSISALRESTLSPYYQKFYSHLLKSFEVGNSFEGSFKSYKNMRDVMPSAVQQIIIAGEQSGNLVKAFLKIGAAYESRTEITSKNLSIALEPILLIIVWIGVVLVALAIILPVYGLIGGINK